MGAKTACCLKATPVRCPILFNSALTLAIIGGRNNVRNDKLHTLIPDPIAQRTCCGFVLGVLREPDK
jgi:hypothetical protein